MYTKMCTAFTFFILYKLNNLYTYGSTKKRKRSERKMINIKSKTQKGITLIALVVTILVLVILAGVSINIVFSNGGILDKAKSAEKRSTIAKEKEIVEMAYLAVSIDKVGEKITSEYLQAELENMVGTDKTITTFDEEGNLVVKFLETGNEYNIGKMGISKSEEKFSEIATETKIYTDEEGNTAIIPKGFAVGKSSTINKINKGLVIQDKDGNQFVWVPAAEYVGNGFYVGRYEAGSEKERTEETTENPTPLVQRDKFVYNYVNYNEAISLCEEMYKELDSVTCSLPNEVDYGIYSSALYNLQRVTRANFSDSFFEVTRGKYAQIKQGDQGRPYSPYNSEDTELYKDVKGIFKKQAYTNVLFTTGVLEKNKASNIFDLDGNVAEWLKNDAGEFKPISGGSFFNNSSETRYVRESGELIYIGFRPVLYINESAYNF